MSWKLEFGVCHEKVKFLYSLMETPLISNGAEIFRIGGFVKIAKSNEKYRHLGGQLHIHILSGVGSRCHSFPLCFVGLDLNDVNHDLKRHKNPGLRLRLDLGVELLFSFNGSPANRRFCRGTTRNKKSGVERQNDR